MNELSQQELQRAESINGEVRVSLETYHKLLSSATKNEIYSEQYQMANDAFQKFMTFLRNESEVDFEDIMQKFNEVNHELNMYINNRGQVRVDLNLTSKE